jgi:hypothetical protein
MIIIRCKKELSNNCPGRHLRVIREVRKTQHQNPEFGHTQGEIKKKPAEKYISIQGGMKLKKPSILVVNSVSSCLRLHYCYIYFHCS